MSIGTVLRRLLRRLPRQLSCYGYDILQYRKIQELRTISGDRPIALLATHDLSNSGAPRAAFDIARALQKLKYTVVVVSQSDGPLRRDFEELGFEVIIDVRPQRKNRYLRDLAQQAEIAVANTVICAPIVAAWAPLVPTCWYLHELSVMENLLRAGAIDEPLANAARIWVGSELCAKIVRKNRRDVIVMPYGVDPLEGSTIKTSGSLEIAVFGSIEPRKGQDLALAGLKLLPSADRENIHLTLFGRPLDAKFFARIIEECRGSEKVTYGGELDREDYYRTIASVDAVLVCSREDTAPLISIDALSAGRMLLLTRDVGTSAWLTDDVDALIESKANPEAMRNLYVRALARRSDANELGQAAQHCFERNFSRAAFFELFRSEIQIAKVTSTDNTGTL